jgi:hypothetical protein
MKKIIFFSIFIFSQLCFSITKLYLDTYYRMLYNSYSNLDFDYSSSTVDITKIYSVVNIDLTTQVDNLEFKTGMSSLGEFGKIVSSSTKQYIWEKNVPYPNTEFLPWLAECYAKYKYNIDIFAIPYTKILVEKILVSITFGRQRKNLVEGMVVGDNKIGYDGITVDFDFGKYFYLNSLVSRINSVDGFQNNAKFDLYSFLLGSRFYSGYNFGINYVVENDEIKKDNKTFYEFFVKQEHKSFEYIFEYIMQQGKNQIEEYTGNLWYFRGEVRGENKYLGKSSAKAVWLLSSSKFYPTFAKMYDYVEPYGFGEFTKANSKTIFFDLPDGYSGVFVLGFELNVNPLKKFYCGLEYYLFSSPEAPDDKPEPSSTEKTLGAKKAVGLEYGLSVQYKFSELLIAKFSYSIFNPVKNAYFDKPKGDPATKISFSIETKF